MLRFGTVIATIHKWNVFAVAFRAEAFAVNTVIHQILKGGRSSIMRKVKVEQIGRSVIGMRP